LEALRVTIRTSAERYALRAEQGVRITSTITNDSARPVYLVTCGRSALFRLERQVGDGWEQVHSPGCDYALRHPVILEPGAALTDVAEIPARGAAGAGVPLTSGMYRAHYAVHGTYVKEPAAPSTGVGDMLPEVQRTSNPFRIAVEPTAP
jgi:hypothetical protein